MDDDFLHCYYFGVILLILGKKSVHSEIIVNAPKEFLKYSTIPPAKIYFNLPLNIEKRKKLDLKRRKATVATKERIEYLIKTFDELKKIN